MNEKKKKKKATQKKVKEIDTFAKDYIEFLSNGKTERECCDLGVSMLEDAGYVELSKVIASGKKLKAGDKVIFSKYAGTDVKYGGEEYTLMNQSDILATVK